MIDETVYGKVLTGRTAEVEGVTVTPPPIRVLTRVEGACGCEVYCGHRLDNFELAIAWYPCDAHKGNDPAGPQQVFARSVALPYEQKEARPVWEVVDDVLTAANA